MQFESLALRVAVKADTRLRARFPMLSNSYHEAKGVRIAPGFRGLITRPCVELDSGHNGVFRIQERRASNCRSWQSIYSFG